jgi:hypothetical protein
MTLDTQAQVVDDLNYLESRGALTGVAEVIRERRRQIEQLGLIPEHDRQERSDGGLVDLAFVRLTDTSYNRHGGISDVKSDERDMAQAGALCAAEIDRLSRLLEPGDPRG